MPAGITINESAISTALSQSLGFDRCYLVGTSTNATPSELNTPTSVKDLAEFISKFPSAPEITVNSVKYFFINFPQGKLFFINAKDAAIIGAPLDKGHYTFALAEISKKQNLELGILTIPEMVNITAQADRTAVYAASESLCQKHRWLNFVNSSTATDTKAKAIAERDLYASPNGHSAYYYGFTKDADNKNTPVAVVAAAIALRRAREETPFEPPAGANYPLQGVSSIVNYVDNDTDYQDLKNKGINVIQQIPKIGWCLWGARTLSLDAKFQQINSRTAISLVSKQLEDSLLPMLFASSDPQGYTRREVTRIAASILQQAYLNGGLSGATPEEAYRFEEVADVTGNLRRVQLKIYARFVDTLEEILVQLVNVDVIPS